ncbi:MAG: hypothetical protein AB1625_05920 [Acidobacteriota bacterium]
MRGPIPISPKLGIVAAVALVVGLAGLLAVRAAAPPPSAAATAVAAPAATVPAPKPIDVSNLEIPCWSCPDATEWPLRFRTDLDLLAPLGTGPGNAGVWFGAFAKVNGPRSAEGLAAMARRVEVPEIGQILPPDDPLLLEAEPWCDQARMRMYPDVFPLSGWTTEITNLLLPLTYARSWIARGEKAASFDDAMADFRRVIRLGRLLRQEDVIVINDLVGLAIIRIGAEAIYDRARRDGRLEVALVAAVVAGEAPAQKYLNAARLTRTEVAPHLRGGRGTPRTLDLPAGFLDSLRKTATAGPDRRMRCEAIIQLQIVAALGPAGTRDEAKQTLAALAGENDAIVSSTARWALEHSGAAEVEKLLDAESVTGS